MSTDPTARADRDAAAALCRHELKFCLNAAHDAALVRALQAFMQPDQRFTCRDDGHYFVRSLYFDDAGFSAYHDKIDGVSCRQIFRLRTYGEQASAPVYLELKARHFLRVLKWRRLLTDFDDAAALCDLLAAPPDSELQRRFISVHRRRPLRPLALVDYWRQPLRCAALPGFRVTFDRGLRAFASTRLFPATPVRQRAFLRGCTIMEVKYQQCLPDWFTAVLRAQRVPATPLSKICHAVQALQLTQD